MAMRFGLLAVVAALVWGVGRLMGVHVPVVVALLFAGVASMPLSWLLFKQFNVNIGAAMAQADGRRRSERAALRAQLAGEKTDAARADERGTTSQE
ncbi:conserved hypothetical protein [Segniliparus rotundus DSM 44985]|uniref:DUF4229 domain-containing protein n=2 Tax=Segniliparus rotundus TaxID=286802 RepID=D6Z870_SEGRD|nr:conserved hypothetical protein [Segniliparus rotundus DSM 44985]